MNVAYSREEMISTTDMLKNFAKTLEKVSTHKIEKIAIMKNNKPEAILLSVDEYERLQLQIYWSNLSEKEYLQKAYVELKNPDTKWYSAEEVDEILEKTIAKYEN